MNKILLKTTLKYLVIDSVDSRKEDHSKFG